MKRTAILPGIARGVLLALFLHSPVAAQKVDSKATLSWVDVPFVGCQAGGQTDLLEAPKGTRKMVTDKLRYLSETVVEYVTPAGREGLGTKSWLKINDRPIHGAAILTDGPDLLHLAVRLPDDLAGLVPAIVRQFESDAAHMPKE